jgi:hypothetical protein
MQKSLQNKTEKSPNPIQILFMVPQLLARSREALEEKRAGIQETTRRA